MEYCFEMKAILELFLFNTNSWLSFCFNFFFTLPTTFQSDVRSQIIKFDFHFFYLFCLATSYKKCLYAMKYLNMEKKEGR